MWLYLLLINMIMYTFKHTQLINMIMYTFKNTLSVSHGYI